MKNRWLINGAQYAVVMWRNVGRNSCTATTTILTTTSHQTLKNHKTKSLLMALSISNSKVSVFPCIYIKVSHLLIASPSSTIISLTFSSLQVFFEIVTTTLAKASDVLDSLIFQLLDLRTRMS